MSAETRSGLLPLCHITSGPSIIEGRHEGRRATRQAGARENSSAFLVTCGLAVNFPDLTVRPISLLLVDPALMVVWAGLHRHTRIASWVLALGPSSWRTLHLCLCISVLQCLLAAAWQNKMLVSLLGFVAVGFQTSSRGWGASAFQAQSWVCDPGSFVLIMFHMRRSGLWGLRTCWHFQLVSLEDFPRVDC